MRRPARWSLLAALCLGGSVHAHGENRDGDGLAVQALASPAEADTFLPSLAPGPEGEVLLSWVQRSGPSAGILRTSTLTGMEWSAPETVAAGDDWFLNWADFPVLAAGVDGTRAACWLARLGTGTYAYGVRFSLRRRGAPGWSEARWLHEDRSPVEHGFVSLLPLPDGGFGAAWLDGRGTAHPGGAMALFFRTIQDDGELGTEEQIDDRVCDCCPTTMVQGSDRAPWIAYRDRSPTEIRDIGFRSRTPAGWVGELVHDDGWEMPGCPVNGPRLALDGSRLAVAWYTGAGGGAGSVLVAFAEVAGFTAPVHIDEGAPEGRVALAFLRDGGLVVSWLAHEEGESRWRARVLDGDELSAAVTIAPVTSGRESGHLRLVSHGDGVVAAWTGAGPVVELARLTRAPAAERK